MLSEHLWEGDCESETNIIEVHVNRLRNKLSRAGAGDVIQTVTRSRLHPEALLKPQKPGR